MSLFRSFLVAGLVCGLTARPARSETLPPLQDGRAPANLTEMWAGFDPRAEPLETEVLKEWQEDNVVLRVVRFRIGVFKGTTAKLAAIYGFPVDAAGGGTKLPGLVQIHGGGQYADHKACLANAKRGYATVSIAWAGRIIAPDYRVSPTEVKLFWEGKTDDPNYRVTTDWGAVDGYHAPGRNPGNVFPSAKPAAWTLDDVESPRNSGWFLCALAARRALTFLEQQPEVDPDRLGVYGHSMGGKLTVMASVDARVKAAAPSCGGISDRYNNSPLFRATIGDDVSLKQITCPIIFLSPSNDFHGRIGDLPDAISEIASKDWRVTCSPHHNHQDTPEYEVATLLWFDQHLKGSFDFPESPATRLNLKSDDGVPTVTARPDRSKPILSVDVFYTQQGVPGRDPHENTMHRFWHHAPATETDGAWTAKLPLSNTDKPLWVYANVLYALDEPVSGVGYYYGNYTTQSFNLSSLLTMVTPAQLADAGARATLKPSTLIEDFQGDWEKEWFTYRPAEWARTTHKLYAETWKAPPGAKLVFEVQAAERNKLIVLLDDYAAEVWIAGGEKWQPVALRPSDFQNYAGQSPVDFSNIRRLKLSPAEHLRPERGESGRPRLVGANWKGTPPRFRDLRWQISDSFLDRCDRAPRDTSQTADYVWTRDHMHVGVRWQPFIGRPQNNACDATRPVIAHPELMEIVDALNLNVSDHSSGHGRIDDLIPSVWAQYDLVRGKLDAAGLVSKSVCSAESWIVWDDVGNAHDMNGDGVKNETDAGLKAITIIGQCLERGLNTINLPWSDNSSGWAMGLTKRRDYNNSEWTVSNALTVICFRLNRCRKVRGIATARCRSSWDCPGISRPSSL